MRDAEIAISAHLKSRRLHRWMESDTTRGNAGWRVTRGSRPSPHRQPAANEGQGTGGCRSVSSVKERRERAIHVTERRTPFCTHVPRASRLRYSISEKRKEVQGRGRQSEHEKRSSPPANAEPLRPPVLRGRRGRRPAPARRRQEFDLPRTERFVLCPFF